MVKQTGNVFFEEGSWYHRVRILRDDGTTQYTKRGGFKTAAEAEQSNRKYGAEYQRALRLRNAATKRDFDFAEYLIFWLDEIYTARATNTSISLAAYVIHDLLLPNVDHRIRLRLVNVEYLDGLLAKASKACPSAGNKCRELLNIAFNDAVAAGFIGRNVVPETKPYPRSKPQIRVLSTERMKVFIRAAANSPWYLEILLALFLGLRKGEIRGLKFSDFDIERKTVHISRQLSRNSQLAKGTAEVSDYNQTTEKEPKTENSVRTLRVPDAVLAEVEKRRLLVESRKGENYADNDYVSAQENGLPHGPSSMNTAISRLCSRNGLPHLTVHGLRHMFATILTEQGVPLAKVSALLGHSSIHTTFEYYAEVMDEEDRIISFMNEKFEPVD